MIAPHYMLYIFIFLYTFGLLGIEFITLFLSLPCILYTIQTLISKFIQAFTSMHCHAYVPGNKTEKSIMFIIKYNSLKS